MSHNILNYLIPALGIIAFIVLAGRAMLFIPRRKNVRQKLKIKSIQDKIQAALADTSGQGRKKSFASSLSSASLNARLQEPKLKLQATVNRDIPEKYKFSIKMAARGIAPDDIASVLDISSAEANQLVQLRNIRRQVTGATGNRVLTSLTCHLF